MKAIIIYLVVHVCYNSDQTDCQVWVPDQFTSYQSCENFGLAHYNDKEDMTWYCVSSDDKDL